MRSENFSDVLKEFEVAKKRIHALLIAKQSKYLAISATKLFDNRSLLRAGLMSPPKPLEGASKKFDVRYGDLTSAPLYTASTRMEQLQAEIRSTRQRNPVVDFEVSFKLYLDCRSEKVIGHIVGEDESAAMSELLACTSAERFAYWNNVDEEDGVSKEDWDARGEVWHAAFRGEFGAYFVIECPYPHWFESREEDIAENIPAFEKRVMDFAKDQACSEYLRGAGAFDGESSMSIYWEYSDKLRNGDADVAALIEKHRCAIAAVLQPAVTLADLRANPVAVK